jgi:hypothetical protein
MSSAGLFFAFAKVSATRRKFFFPFPPAADRIVPFSLLERNAAKERKISETLDLRRDWLLDIHIAVQPRRTAPNEGARFAKLLPSTNDDSRYMICFSKMGFCGLQSERLKRRRRRRLQ